MFKKSHINYKKRTLPLYSYMELGKKQTKKDLDLTILLEVPYIFFIYLISFLVFASLVYLYQQINSNNLIF